MMLAIIKSMRCFLLVLLLILTACDDPYQPAPLPEETIEFISYIYGETDEAQWQSCQKFFQHFPSLEKVGESETIQCLDTMTCQNIEARSALLHYIRSRSSDSVFIEFFSFVSHHTGDELIRSCQKFISHFPSGDSATLTDLIDCYDVAICQSAEGRSAFLAYMHKYLQAL